MPCTEKHYPSTKGCAAESVTSSSLKPAATWTVVKPPLFQWCWPRGWRRSLPWLSPSAASVTAVSSSRGGRSRLCRRVTLLLRSPRFTRQPAPLQTHRNAIVHAKRWRGTYEQGQRIVCQAGWHPGWRPVLASKLLGRAAGSLGYNWRSV